MRQKKTEWLEAEIEYVAEHYPHSPVKDIVRELNVLFGNNRTTYSVTAYAHRHLGLRKSQCKESAQVRRVVVTGAVTVHRII